MRSVRILYWLLVGGMIGFGLIGLLSIGFPFIILGVILLTVGALRFGGREAFAALTGFGAVPAAILLWDVASGPWACDTGVVTGGSGSPNNVSYYSCVETPLGPLTTYHVMAAIFLVLALAGLVALLLFGLRRPGAQTTRSAGG